MDNSHILKEVLVQIFGFVIVFFILKKLAWKNLLGMIDQRRGKIEAGFQDIENQKKSLAQLEKDYRARIENIEQEARVKIQDAANVGMGLARDIQEKARQDAQKMIDRAHAEIQQDIAKARVSMRADLVELSSLISEKIIREKLDAKEHDKLVDQFLKEIQKV